MDIKLLLERIILTEGRVENARKKYPNIPDKIFDYYVDNDPSGNQKYLNWVLKTITADWGITQTSELHHGHYDLLSSLTFFHENNQAFNKKDINHYKNLTMFFQTIAEVREKVRQKKEEKKAKKQRNLVYQDKDWVVISPKSHLASCVYGSGTKWCVTMKDYSHHWDRYSKNATFFFIIDKNKDDSDNLYKVAFRKIGRSGKVELWDAKDSEFSGNKTGLDYLEKLPKKMLELIEKHHRIYFPESEGPPEWIEDKPRAQALYNHTDDEDLMDTGDFRYGIPIYETSENYYQVANERELDDALWEYYDEYDDWDLLEYYDEDGYYLSLIDEEEFINEMVESHMDNMSDTEILEYSDKLDQYEDVEDELIKLQDSEDFSEDELIKLQDKQVEILELAKENVIFVETEHWFDCLADGVVECLVNDHGLYRSAYELHDSGVTDFDRSGLIENRVYNSYDWDEVTGGYGYETNEDFNGNTWYVYEIDY